VPAALKVRLYILDQPGNGSEKLTEPVLKDARIRRIPSGAVPEDRISVLRQGSTLLIESPGDPLLMALSQQEDGDQTTECALIAPLLIRLQVFGLLALTSPWPSTFGEPTRPVVEAFATTASTALQNSILYGELQELATTDALTGLFNRRTFYELGQRIVEQSARFGRPLSVVTLDIDSLQRVNQIHGHTVGDQVLKEVAARCFSVARYGHILGRYGADTFAILLPEANLSTATTIADHIREAVAATPIQTDAGPVYVTVSTGVAESKQRPADLGLLLDTADEALLRSKESGRSTITVTG
jgi:diguanylate cyclase (GGDEF)-like protein